MRIFKYILCAVVVGIVALSFGMGRVWKSQKNLNLNPVTYQGIISVWHIDSFEGGIGSRKQFLLDSGIAFEKKFNGVLIMVTSHTAYSAEENFKKGIFPDLISYGVGLNTQNVSQIEGGNSELGRIGDKAYASVWCRGGYYLIENPSYKGKEMGVTVSKSATNSPFTALALSDEQVTIKNVLSPLDAYVEFVNGKSKYLLGTQRDIFRLLNRGKDFTAKLLRGFSDLNQFISITTLDQQKRYYAQQFIDHLTSSETQQKLNKIGMFSVSDNVQTDNQYLQQMNGAKIEKGLSAFITKENIEEINRLGADYLKVGKEEELIKIKNLLV